MKVFVQYVNSLKWKFLFNMLIHWNESFVAYWNQMIAYIKCLLKQKFTSLYIGRNKMNVFCSLCVEMKFFIYSEIHDFLQGRVPNFFSKLFLFMCWRWIN